MKRTVKLIFVVRFFICGFLKTYYNEMKGQIMFERKTQTLIHLRLKRNISTKLLQMNGSFNSL